MSELHPRLAADTRPLADTHFAWLRYMNDQRFPWLIVVPKQPDLREWFELSEADQQLLLKLVNQLSAHLQRITGATKMNLGALGNLVPQLHIHIIARQPGDPCWPGPVWGQGAPLTYADNATPAWLADLQSTLNEEGFSP